MSVNCFVSGDDKSLSGSFKCY